MPRKIDVNPSNYAQPEGMVLNEDRSGLEHEGIEVVSEMPSMTEADLEAFMHEKVTIRLHKIKGARPEELVSPTVNGRPHHLVRGFPQVVARKYVEVLARSHEVSYDYSTDPSQAILEGQMPTPTASPIHSFEVLRDSEKGHAWLEDILRQAI